ncbi:dethiobiotin synthase [Legionella bononiensis]|uniref:ATP-dependent dethiobiotin synthetase BioD n=1 Tax=Legionella bononiensis TaxID=2793102 RepID=A0ABS1WF55_9GAMM|nr:dethiobiotin synthase [Legionella bononiensis]MBL7479284.1 dethiobiotin synthase [Legionella bononiensis]MBL7527988.1 dethiobiotin synthase [Legionella bononiensis]MBL7563935.1 dethiobiotin synthase [Legionella bononiensis]
MKRYFITGTDTDCGKTFVTGKLVEYFSNAVAIKPIASGCSVVMDQLINSDAQHLMQNSPLSMDQINPWRFPLPVSPHLAAQDVGVVLDIHELSDYCLSLEVKEADIMFIEGAGGLMVPLNHSETWIEFLKASEIPVIFVVGMQLGCINHALLTGLALKTHHIECAGWIANCLDPDMLLLDENIETLKNLLEYPLLATLPFGSELIDVNLSKIKP